jgi:hypothetical protein
LIFPFDYFVKILKFFSAGHRFTPFAGREREKKKENDCRLNEIHDSRGLLRRFHVPLRRWLHLVGVFFSSWLTLDIVIATTAGARSTIYRDNKST